MSTMSNLQRQRGFTFVEIAITSFVVLMALMACSISLISWMVSRMSASSSTARMRLPSR